jgi:hypothetical protein
MTDDDLDRIRRRLAEHKAARRKYRALVNDDSFWLTAEEVVALRKQAKEDRAWFKKKFAHLRAKES